MSYTGITRLKLNTDTGSIQMGSGEIPTYPQGASEVTQEEVDRAQPIDFDTFSKLTVDPRYKGNPLDYRAGEQFRREVEAGFIKWQQQQAARAERDMSTLDTAGQVAQVANIPYAIARGAIENMGPFATREERAKAYQDSRYKTSEDYRNFVAAREAITEDF
jgi:hypothetical protein